MLTVCLCFILSSLGFLSLHLCFTFPKSYVTSLKFWCALYSCMNNLWTQLNDQAVLLPLILIAFITFFFCLGRKMSQLASQIISPHNYKDIKKLLSCSSDFWQKWSGWFLKAMLHYLLTVCWQAQAVKAVRFSEWFVHTLIHSMMSLIWTKTCFFTICIFLL